MKRGAIVLCGGQSTRMGRDKALLPFGEETMLQRVVRLLAPVVGDLVVVGRRDQVLPDLPAEVRVTCDEVEGQGPLGGLGPGLTETRAEAVYVTGCDVPFLQTAVVELLFATLERDASLQVVVPEAGGYKHPLAAVYRATVLPELQRLFAEGRRRPRDLFDAVSTCYVGEQTLRSVDADLLTLSNLNTPEAYARAQGRLAAERVVIRVELYEGARQAAGVAVVEVEARTLGEALAATAHAHPVLEGTVIVGNRPGPHWRASVNGRRFVSDPETVLERGDAVVLVSALAGG